MRILYSQCPDVRLSTCIISLSITPFNVLCFWRMNQSTNDPVRETASLLSEPGDSASGTSCPKGIHAIQDRLMNTLALQNISLVLCVYLLQFLISFAKHVVEVPAIRLFEVAICTRYYASQGVLHEHISESMCKIPVVQDELSVLTGWKFFFDNLPGLLTAIYFGKLSDKWGRRPILSLFCIGTICSYAWIVAICYANAKLPPRLIWASSAFILLGAGGQRVCKAMQFTIIADNFEQPHR